MDLRDILRGTACKTNLKNIYKMTVYGGTVWTSKAMTCIYLLFPTIWHTGFIVKGTALTTNWLYIIENMCFSHSAYIW